ncbi:MAG: DNA-formamidopyrimidine glycosylase family protein [Candidatus Binatia bacterium]|nr:DNA-formamidopyrimidine glycosylase family protein [Candidatus Binatia bacterium]
MPEGHTLHKLARDLSRDFVGKTVSASSPQGRFKEGAARIDGRKLSAAEAWGKHLFLRFGRTHVHVHLGLFGRFRRRRMPPPTRCGAVRLRLEDSRWIWDLSGPTACEILSLRERTALIDRLGPDPLRSNADPDAALARIAQSRRSIGALLLDQSVIAGIGNVYRAEVLFLAGIHPERTGRSLTDSERADLWSRSVALLRRGAELGRIVTVDEPGRTSGERLWVYKRRVCKRCSSRIRSSTIASRKIWNCPRCQPAA